MLLAQMRTPDSLLQREPFFPSTKTTFSSPLLPGVHELLPALLWSAWHGFKSLRRSLNIFHFAQITLHTKDTEVDADFQVWTDGLIKVKP